MKILHVSRAVATQQIDTTPAIREMRHYFKQKYLWWLKAPGITKEEAWRNALQETRNVYSNQQFSPRRQMMKEWEKADAEDTTTTPKKPPKTVHPKDALGPGWTQLQIKQADAEATKGLADDRAIAALEMRFLRDRLNKKNITADQVLQIKQAIAEVQARIVSFNPALVDPLSSDEWKKLQLRQLRAEETKGTKDDTDVANAQLAYLRRRLNRKGATLDQQLQLQGEISSVQARKKSLKTALMDAIELVTPAMDVRMAKAEATKSTKDDIAAQRAEIKYLEGLIKHHKLKGHKLAEAIRAVKEAKDKIKELKDAQSDATHAEIAAAQSTASL
jgi:hypothetical protein